MGWLSLAGGVVGVVKGGIDLLTGRQKRKEREEYRKAGRNEQALAQHEEANEAQERMDSVKPAGDDAAADRMRKGQF